MIETVEPAAPPDTALNADPLRDALVAAVGDDYEVVRLIGRGGMGAVYLARDRALERLVAIKVLPPGSATDAGMLERFRREAKTVASLQHVGIVPLYAFGERRGLCWFVMGYVRGESLAARIDREAPLDPETARTLIAQIADALEYAHRQGIVHRDIKPDNVLIDDTNGRALLTDFGIARADRLIASTSLTQVGAVMGTPHYMSPEQATAEPNIDGRSDLYSVGVAAYQMLSGRLPFNGQSFRELLMQHVSATPVPLADVAPGVPADLADAVMRCLEKDPDKRIPDGRSLRDAVGGAAYDDETLTYELAELKHSVAWVVVIAVLSVVFAASLAVRNASIYGVKWALWLVLPLVLWVLALKVREATRRGYDSATIRRVMTLPPRWWWLWWPKKWRRNGDVYPSLPRSLKVARWFNAFSTFLGLSEIPLLSWVTSDGRFIPRERLPAAHAFYDVRWLRTLDGLDMLVVLFGFLLVFVASTMVSRLIARRVGGRFGIKGKDLQRLAYKPTDSPFWRDPRIQAVIRGTRPQRKPATPSEFVSQILAAAGTLPPTANTAGASVTTAARQLLDAITSDERELALLEKSAPREQLDRLEAELVLLESDEGESESLVLLSGQRDALLRSRERMQLLGTRRDQRTSLLENIWSDLRLLSSAPDAATAQDVTTRLAQHCEAAQAAAPKRRTGTGAQRTGVAVMLLVTAATVGHAWQSTQASLSRGREMLARGEPDSALATLGAITGDDRYARDAHVVRGDAYFLIGSRQRLFGRVAAARHARAEYDRVLVLDSANVHALEGLAWFHRLAPRYLGGNRETASSLLRALDRHAPYHSTIMRAYFSRLEGRADAADASLRALVASAPDSAAGWFALGDVALADGRADVALAAFNRYRQLMPSDPFALLQLGQLAAVHGVQLDAGAAGLRDFIQHVSPVTKQSQDMAWWRLGQILEKQGQRDAARAAYQKAVALDPKFDDFATSLRALDASRP